MPVSIRRAVPQDAQAIVDIIAAAFHEEANPTHIQAGIEANKHGTCEGEHLTFVAEDEKVVGFIDGFYTLSQTRTCRLELDLLAVHPEHSGKGIGKALINIFGEAIEDARLIRALVAVSNTPMHQAMRNTGYQMREQAMSLFISSEGKTTTGHHQAHLIAVETFTYRGIWLEGIISKEAITTAHFVRESLNMDVVGAVVPSDAHSTIEILQASGFEFIKEFQWWEKRIITDYQEFPIIIR
jgi:GNAT superfamily N-acetyltransferase